MCIGNPIRAEGKFVDLIRQAARDRADNVPPRLAVNAIRIPSTESPHAHQEKSEFGLADRTWLESMYRKYGKGSLWVGSHIDARIPDVDAEQLIDLTWLDHHSEEQRPQVPPTHPINFTRRIACDLAEGVGRDSTCIMVLDDWGVLEVVLSNAAGLPKPPRHSSAGNQVERTARQDHVRQAGDRPQLPQPSGTSWNHDGDPLRRGGRPQDPNSYVNRAPRPAGTTKSAGHDTQEVESESETGKADPATLPLSFSLVPQAPFYFCPGEDDVRLVDELRPLTYGLVGKRTKLLPKDEWATILGHSPDVADALIQSMILS